MRLGLFVAVLISLVVVVGLVAPVPGGLPPLSTVSAEIPMRTQCLALETEEPLFDEFLPRPLYVQLLPQERPHIFPHGPWYRADIGPDSLRALFSFSAWQPAGPDSIDIAWYHSPPIRIPARGERRVGRVTRRGYINLFHALLSPDRIARVNELRCPARSVPVR
jgi:hypothetical protein